ncbi:MAG: adenylyltransferase/cytidyltransferase family protein [Clostridia bacterium]|nr:adenylyltransferase/cytidyltransferase family protein [Clostridia bacterium]
MVIGYTTGVYDLFHIGHLNLLRNAKSMCDKLVVGVSVDDLVLYKGKRALIPFEERIEIVKSIKYVDAAIPQYDMDKLTACKKIGASILFVGDDWYGTEKWQDYEKQFKEAGIRIVYFPYTKGVSSTIINSALNSLRADANTQYIDKYFCMSSFLTYRYVEKNNVDFYQTTRHVTYHDETKDSDKTLVSTADEIDAAIQKQFDALKGEKLGILLSGGMDSAILASYMRGCDAYTFRFLGGKLKKDELERAEYYAKYYGLKLHYVDINWEDTVLKYTDELMKRKGAPIHSIEPQLLQAALQAKADGITKLIYGDGSDIVFGGMDGLLAKDWSFDEFVKRFTYIEPKEVLKNPVNVSYLYERYRKNSNDIDYVGFVENVFGEESYNSYFNAFKSCDLSYLDPYSFLKMRDPLDLERVRNGESKYLIRELFHKKYPEIPVPNKVPMPRPVDEYFKDWEGPKRPEFREDIDMSKFAGNQKWMLWCLERFLNNNEPV